MRITAKDIQNSKVAHLNKHLFVKPVKRSSNKKAIKPAAKSKEKDWLAWNLFVWCKEKGYTLKSEHQFDKERNYRFDHAIMELKVAVEYEGLFSEKSGHTTASGYTKDTEKYNGAQVLGWIVFRYTAVNYKKVLKDLDGHVRTTS